MICEQYQFIKNIAAIYADIGVSSPQLDEQERGFSFAQDAALDMRMNPEDPDRISAADLIAKMEFHELRKLIRGIWRRSQSHEIAKAIMRAKESAPIISTMQLAAIVKSAIHYKTPSRIHPATRTFQALRIAVNGELEALESLLMQAKDLLTVGGRLGIISFTR